jgi:ComF family protein
MAEWLAATDIDLPDRLVPVPLHSKRHRQRGFNQARELARPIRSVLDVPIADGLIARAAAAPPQAELPLDRRRQNIRNQFQCRHRPPPHVAIIDDVVTSASTVAELARCLKRAGAERVDVYAVARTP